MAIRIAPPASQAERQALATSFYEDLVLKLEGGRAKRIDDGLWFDFNRQGCVSLHRRPYKFLEIVWELLVRLFTSKYTRIEKEIRLLTSEVNDYLSFEDDPVRRAQFLNEYTPLVSELFRSAALMEFRGRIHPIAMHLRSKYRALDLMMVFPHSDVPDRRYRFHGLFSVGSEMPDAEVRFRFNDPLHVSGGRDIETPVNRDLIHSCDVKSTGASTTLVADVKRNFSTLMTDANQQIVICPNGAQPEVRQEGKGVSFFNATDRHVRVEIANPRVGFLIEPGRTRACAGIQGNDKLDYSVSYSEESPPFQIGCWMARYMFKLNAQGHLSHHGEPNLIVTPLSVPQLMVAAQDIFLDRGARLHLEEGNHDRLLVLRAANKEERIFVPARQPFAKDYASLRREFGAEWDGHLNMSWCYPTPHI